MPHSASSSFYLHRRLPGAFVAASRSARAVDAGTLQRVAHVAARDGIVPRRLGVRALIDTRMGAAD